MELDWELLEIKSQQDVYHHNVNLFYISKVIYFTIIIISNKDSTTYFAFEHLQSTTFTVLF